LKKYFFVKPIKKEKIMEIKKIIFGELFGEELKNEEGLVCLGTGGNQQEWIKGVTNLLKREGIAENDFEFKSAYALTTTGKRHDLVLVFPDGVKGLDMSRLPIWRIGFGECSWLSDYKDNYGDQHDFLPQVSVSISPNDSVTPDPI
jgi:hypothetical protein